MDVFVNFFLKDANAELNKNITGLSEDAMNCFMEYQWPGNIRELKNVIKRAALLTNDSTIQAKHLPLEISNPSKFISAEPAPNNGQDANQLKSLKNAAHEAEYEVILNVLKQVNFNKTKAAQMLNIDRKTLYNKMKIFNLLSEGD